MGEIIQDGMKYTESNHIGESMKFRKISLSSDKIREKITVEAIVLDFYFFICMIAHISYKINNKCKKIPKIFQKILNWAGPIFLRRHIL